MKLNQAYIPLRKAKVNISPENQMICHSIEYLLWWTDERDEGIEEVTQQKTGSMPASPGTYTYKYIHMFVF